MKRRTFGVFTCPDCGKISITAYCPKPACIKKADKTNIHPREVDGIEVRFPVFRGWTVDAGKLEFRRIIGEGEDTVEEVLSYLTGKGGNLLCRYQDFRDGVLFDQLGDPAISPPVSEVDGVKILPVFRGWTVDVKLGEFRRAIEGESIETLSFSEKIGDDLLSDYLETLPPGHPDFQAILGYLIFRPDDEGAWKQETTIVDVSPPPEEDEIPWMDWNPEDNID